jgi:colanic acid/amylovoran biosynthesis glycosyltransferase
MAESPTHPPVVAVWRDAWLPRSETFIRDHVTSLRRWQPLLLGLRRVEGGLGVEPHRAPFANHGLRRWAWAACRRTGYLGVYDSILRRQRPRLMHAHFGTNAVEILPVAQRVRLPLVVSFHGIDVTTALLGPGGARYRERLERLWNYASLLLPVSDDLERRLLALGAPPDKVRRHYMGINVATLAPVSSTPRSGIVYVGRLIAQKGVADLIDAVAQLPEHRRSTPVTIIGDGPERQALQAQAAAVRGARIRFLGPQSNDVVADELSRAAILSCPSRAVRPTDTEGFGQVFLEAARAGVPSVAYRFGGVVEAVQDGVTGLLAPEGDVAALSAHLLTLLDDPELAARLGAAGADRVRQHFDLTQQSAILESLYDQVAAGATVTGGLS